MDEQTFSRIKRWRLLGISLIVLMPLLLLGVQHLLYPGTVTIAAIRCALANEILTASIAILMIRRFGRALATTISQSRELARSVATREDFIGMAAHELKTPLTTLKLTVMLNKRYFEQNELTPARTESMFRTTAEQLSRLEVLITDMLDLTSIQSGRMPAAYKLLDLAEVLPKITARFAERVHFQASGAVIGWWDHHRIDQVVSNLVTNGIKYGRGQVVEVALNVEDDQAVITVADKGIGIKEADQERIFQRFERVDHAATVGGLGLGLFIVTQIVEANGGTITVASLPDVGSTFTVRLPIRDQKPIEGVPLTTQTSTKIGETQTQTQTLRDWTQIQILTPHSQSQTTTHKDHKDHKDRKKPSEPGALH